MPAHCLIVGNKKAARFGENLYLLMRDDHNGDWLSVKNGEVIAREAYNLKDFQFLELIREWATMTAEREKNIRVGIA